MDAPFPNIFEPVYTLISNRTNFAATSFYRFLHSMICISVDKIYGLIRGQRVPASTFSHVITMLDASMVHVQPPTSIAP